MGGLWVGSVTDLEISSADKWSDSQKNNISQPGPYLPARTSAAALCPEKMSCVSVPGAAEVKG